MKITAGILFYLLKKDRCVQQICHGADRCEITRFEQYRDQLETEEGVLYIRSGPDGAVLFCSRKKYKTAYILANAGKDESEAFSLGRIRSRAGREDADPDITVTEDLLRIRYNFSLAQNEILEAVFSREGIEEVMAKVRSLLREPFTVVDRDMLLLYQCPEIPPLLSEKLGASYARELEEELLTAKEFHAAARLDEPFYYRLELLEQDHYCINILADDHYCARLVVMTEPAAGRLESGAEQLSEYLAWIVTEMIRQGTVRLKKSRDDLLHRLCLDVAGGVRPGTLQVTEAFKAYGWSEGDVFLVFCLEPYNAAGWEPQIENTMPLLVRKLEQTWVSSCAAYVGRQIIWIIDHTRLEKADGEYEMMQELVIFLRENVLRAGSSSRFSGAGLLSSAYIQAAAALELGTKKYPSRWFHRFDDHRLDYMMNAIRDTEIDPELLIHPAIPLLLDHDAEHDSRLSETLRALVEKRGNISRAAEALFIHRTTFFRRLNQIKELTGLDFDDPDVMLELQISYRIAG